METKRSTTIKHFRNVAEFSKFLKRPETKLVGFFEKESDLLSIFSEYAHSMDKRLRIGYCTDSDILRLYEETNAIIIFRDPQLQNKYEASTVKFEGNTLQELKEFVKKNLHGLFGHRTRKSARDFKAPCIIAYFDEDLVDNLDKISYWRKRILKVARIFAGRINFAFCDKEDFPDEVGEFDFDFADGNPLILAHDSSHRTFRMTDEFSFDNLRNFATKLDNGGLESTISQESIPLMDSHVKVVGDESFEELVLENGKDTLVGIYAPWCADCEFLNPVFEEIAEKLKKESVSIVQIDDTVVTPPKAFQSPFYPSILWLPKNDKSEPQPYTGRRQVQDIIKFIAEKATSELNGYDREGNEKPKRIQTVTKKVMKI